MNEILDITHEIFSKILPVDWREIFHLEFKEYWKWMKLRWFYLNWKLIWWLCLWYNPDYFNETKWNEFINKLNNEWFIKISYFFISDKYRWNLYWKDFLSEILKENKNSYFLTCTGEWLRKYYSSIWFKQIYNENKKYLFIYKA